MKSYTKRLLAALTIFCLGLAQPTVGALPDIVNHSLKPPIAKSPTSIDTAKQLFFSDPVQKLVATMDRFAYLKKDTDATKRGLFMCICAAAPLGMQLGQCATAALNNEKNVSPVGLIIGTTSTAYAWACLGIEVYTEAALNRLKEKIKQKQPLSTYEVQKALELSLYYYAYNRGKTKNYHTIRYNFYDPAVWDHPQLQSNKKLISSFIKCFKHSPRSYFCPNNHDVITAILNEHPSLVKRIKTGSENYLNNDQFSDLLIKRYIEEYMQPNELDMIIDIVLSHSYPHSTALLKSYITPEHAAALFSKYHYQYRPATPLWDYVYSIYAAHNLHTADHSALFANVLSNLEQFPQILQLYAQPPYLPILQQWILQADSLLTKNLGIIDQLITAIPALIDTFKVTCMRTCPTYSGWPGRLHNNTFFKEIFIHHLKKRKGAAQVHREIIKALKDPELTRLYRSITRKKMYVLLPDNSGVLTGPTKRYIDQYPHQILEKFGTDLNNAALQRLSREIIALESQEERRGHFTFLHGEPKQMHTLQYWFTKLYEIKNQVILDDYIFTRFPKDTGLLNQAYAWGNRMHHGHNGNRTDVFMAHCLYSNSHGACAGDYYLRNRAIHNFHQTLNQIFKKFGYGALYTKYKKELKALSEEYRTICPYGQVLLFSFSQHALRKSVYIASPGGRRRSVTLSKKQGATITTYDIVTIARAMRDNLQSVQDYENLEFCFIPTIDYGLHPDIAGKEIRVFNLTGADPEKMKAYRAKEQVLLETIQADIEAQTVDASKNNTVAATIRA